MKCYCESCKTIFNECDIICGEAYAEDYYDNASCPECFSEEICEIDESDICGICGKYHEEKEDCANCAKEIYEGIRGQVWALRYIDASVGTQEAADYMERNDMRIEEYILDEPEEFVRFVCEKEETERRETIRLYERTGMSIPKYLLKENA